MIENIILFKLNFITYNPLLFSTLALILLLKVKPTSSIEKIEGQNLKVAMDFFFYIATFNPIKMSFKIIYFFDKARCAKISM